MYKILRVIFLLLVFSVSAEAEVYKCTMQDGSITYSQIECMNSGSSVKKVGRESNKDIINGGQTYEVHALCSKKYSNDEGMRKSCIDIQASSLGKLQRIQSIYSGGTTPHRDVDNCINEWKDEEGLVDYRMALKCYRKNN